MARKRQKAEDEAFTPPEFDEITYMRREVEGAKAGVVTFALAVAMAAASAEFTLAGVWPVGILLMFVVPFLLPRIYPLARVKLATFDRRTWASMVAILVLSWMSLWILFINPPLVDTTPPVVRAVYLEDATGGRTPVQHSGDTVTLHNVSAVTVVAYVPDSDPVTASFDYTFQGNGTPHHATVNCDQASARCPLPLANLVPNQAVGVTITATDTKARTTGPFGFTLVVSG